MRLDYELSPSWKQHWVGIDLASASETALQYDFTESDSTIQFERSERQVTISANYVDGRTRVELRELRRVADCFLRRVIADLSASEPTLAKNPFVTRVVREFSLSEG